MLFFICVSYLLFNFLQDDSENDDESGEGGKKVIVGVCAMAKKSQSKPMKEILTRLQVSKYKNVACVESLISLG